MPLIPLSPPRPNTAEGKPRRVGIEVEFTGLDAAMVADLVAARIGGTVEMRDPHAYRVLGSRIGDVAVELDMMAAHPKDAEGKWLAPMRSLLGKAGSVVMPYELSFAPLDWSRLPELDDLFDALRRAGGRGTEANLLSAFGLHLNPEIAEPGTDYVIDHMKAFALLEPWLRAAIRVDLARDVAPYIERYPPAYAAKLVDPGYRPGRDALIEDYLADNPSRNRGLDMLPLFAWLDRERILSRISDAHVRPRPTFHYRLPNSYLGEPGWSVVPDWNRWVEVERLAADQDRLARMGTAFRDGGFALRPSGDWAEATHDWLHP
jgi:hypothetical protein